MQSSPESSSQCSSGRQLSQVRPGVKAISASPIRMPLVVRVSHLERVQHVPRDEQRGRVDLHERERDLTATRRARVTTGSSPTTAGR